MAHTLIESSSYDTVVTVPDDGDGLNSATTFVRPHQAITNRQRYLYDRKPNVFAASSGVPYGDVGGARAAVETVTSGSNSTVVTLGIGAGIAAGSILTVVANIPVLAPSSTGSGSISALYLYDTTNAVPVGTYEGCIYTLTSASPEAMTLSFVTRHIVTAGQEANGMDIYVHNADNSTDPIQLFAPWSITAITLAL